MDASVSQTKQINLAQSRPLLGRRVLLSSESVEGATFKSLEIVTVLVK